MGQIVPDAVERYLASFTRADPVLLEIARAGAARDLPLVDAETGALLRIFAVACGATRILEIGTAIGYSGIWLAGALAPGGMLLTMEADEQRAREARENFTRAGMADRVNVMIGDAQRTVAKVAGPFDLIFQDGDKKTYTAMLNRLVSLLRPGGLLVTDNVLWSGDVVPGFATTPHHDTDSTRAIAEYNRLLNDHPELTTAIVPLRDGLAVSVKHRSA